MVSGTFRIMLKISARVVLSVPVSILNPIPMASCPIPYSYCCHKCNAYGKKKKLDIMYRKNPT